MELPEPIPPAVDPLLGGAADRPLAPPPGRIPAELEAARGALVGTAAGTGLWLAAGLLWSLLV